MTAEDRLEAGYRLLLLDSIRDLVELQVEVAKLRADTAPSPEACMRLETMTKHRDKRVDRLSVVIRSLEAKMNGPAS